MGKVWENIGNIVAERFTRKKKNAFFSLPPRAAGGGVRGAKQKRPRPCARQPRATLDRESDRTAPCPERGRTLSRGRRTEPRWIPRPFKSKRTRRKKPRKHLSLSLSLRRPDFLLHIDLVRAIRDDPVRLEEASKDPQVAKVLLGDDMDALQELLRAYHLAEKRRRSDMAHRSTDAQRVSATVPR